MFSSVNTCWTLVGAFLVYFMQAGFALCEAGFTRAKNTGNILMKNMMDFCIGTPCYWIIGFGLMFGGTGALIGGFDPFIQGDYSHRAGLRQEVFGNFSKFIRLSARKSLLTSCLHISLNIFSIGFLAVSDCFTHTIKVVLPICTE